MSIVASASCRPHPPSPRANGDAARVARGAVLYASYCRDCHGQEGHGDGPVARTLRLKPTNLRQPGLFQGVSDAEITARVLHGDPLRTAPRGAGSPPERQVRALDHYVSALDTRPWESIRAGRIVFEDSCAPCHGPYGAGAGVIGWFLARPAADLDEAGPRYTDAALAAVARRGVGAMPPAGDTLSDAEMNALIAYIRVLSPGYRLYDSYCASCHGDDGRGVHPEDALPPALVAPPLEPARLAQMSPQARHDALLHMFERESGLMPHFRDTLDERRLGDIIAYLRTVAR